MWGHWWPRGSWEGALGSWGGGSRGPGWFGALTEDKGDRDEVGRLVAVEHQLLKEPLLRLRQQEPGKGGMDTWGDTGGFTQPLPPAVCVPPLCPAVRGTVSPCNPCPPIPMTPPTSRMPHSPIPMHSLHLHVSPRTPSPPNVPPTAPVGQAEPQVGSEEEEQLPVEQLVDAPAPEQQQLREAPETRSGHPRGVGHRHHGRGDTRAAPWGRQNPADEEMGPWGHENPLGGGGDTHLVGESLNRYPGDRRHSLGTPTPWGHTLGHCHPPLPGLGRDSPLHTPPHLWET